MRIVEALTINNALSGVKITGEGVDHTTRSLIIKNKIELSKVQKLFEEYRSEVAKECNGDEVLFRGIVEEYIVKEATISPNPLTEEQLNTLLDHAELPLSIVELLFTHLIAIDDDRSNIN